MIFSIVILIEDLSQNDNSLFYGIVVNSSAQITIFI